ncbi:hypothetical protein CVT24_004101 [Panaeolus cyanescens]|uniref:Protein kinase domain-containing protein n=1 Tax=Panaeolus cyanescens TaxID=181874 RepID=A0A409Y5W8_9AGAR|nr:hypothetical protein CVT24_004101 [Panaeolus cyanescens]
MLQSVQVNQQLSQPSPKYPVTLQDFRHNDLSSPVLHQSLLNRKRPHKESFSRPTFPPTTATNTTTTTTHAPIPLAISTNLPLLSSNPSSASPSTASAKLPRSPYISSRQLHSASPVPVPTRLRTATKSSARYSITSSMPVEDVLAPGDVVGEGFPLQGEYLRLVSSNVTPDAAHHQEPAQEFEVVKQLGTGSYAVVYLVQEVLHRPPTSDDGHMSTIGVMEFDNKMAATSGSVVYGRKYAIKCLSKANLDEEALALQMTEATIHQSLRSHPNIVTLYRTLETSAFLLLLLEYVPGEDLFYFLEQSRDHYDLDYANNNTDLSVSSSHTPPTPSLLSNLHPSQLLSRTRLRLIASMFGQMCDAVAACHEQQVFHRDIKPENFIVTDGFVNLPDGRSERKVIVKLTDFGLSTTDIESSDMDCGSAPYMSYECRNNVAPTYRPRAADVWSLGIVLINMLYHINPWMDTAMDACHSFDVYRRDPVNFFLSRFTGMTKPVADFLAHKVFCILQDPQDDSPRVTAADFGIWAKNLPTLLGGGHGVHRTVSNSSTQGHRLSLTMPISHRPTSRPPSVCGMRTPAIPQRSLSRAPSLGPAYEREELFTVLDPEDEDDDPAEADAENEGTNSRSTSTNKRRKRGARKGKGTAAAAAAAVASQDATLATLADASQSLAREISMASKTSSRSNSKPRKAFEPVSMYAMPSPLLNKSIPKSSRSDASTSASPAVTSTASTSTTIPAPTPVTKKPSIWKIRLGKSNTSAPPSTVASSSASINSTPSLPSGTVSAAEELRQPSMNLSPAHAMSTTANNVSNLIMGLNAPPFHNNNNNNLSNSDDTASTWSRGRRINNSRSPPTSLKSASRSPGYPLSTSPPTSGDHWNRSERAISPHSTRSGRPVASSASSVVSSNWRSSMSTSSSAGTSTSAFTRYSNNSARSISTTATSVSSASWRTSIKPTSTYSSHQGYASGNIPRNIKIMDGVPWELDQLPRGQHPNPVGDIFGAPPVRKPRTRKQPKDLKLDTITERPSGPKSPENLRRDASTSTTDLGNSSGSKEEADGVKKVQKGQINALAKMLFALRR